MKKNLMALALLGAFSGAALAQSNVTLYGIIDVNFQYNDPDCNTTAAQNCSSTRGINSGHQSGSRWGVRGSEALGRGLNGVFTLEGGYNADTGTQAQGGRLFGRQVWAGLSGAFGQLVAGRVATFSSGTGSFDLFGNTDPFLTGFGDSGLQNTFTSAGALRLDNSVLYRTPSLAGFNAGVGYSFQGNGVENAGSGNNNRVWFTGVNFARGPFFAAVTYDRIELTDAGVPGAGATPRIAVNSDDQWHLQAGLTFDLKFLKLHGGYAKENRVYVDAGLAVQPDAGADADAWMGGITVPLGAAGGTILASYQKRSGDPVTTCTAAAVAGACPLANVSNRERDVAVWAIGYTYPFSRRTNIYVNFSDRDEDLDFRAGLAGGGFGPAVDQQRAGFDRRQYTVGVRHLF